jgi:hypothetical protein
MNLAPILAFYFLSSGWSPPLVSAETAQATQPQPSIATDSNSPATQSQGSESSPKPQVPAQSSGSTQPLPSSTGQAPDSPAKAQSPAKRRRHPKKTIYPDCSISPTPLNPAAGNSTDPAKTTDGASTGAGSTAAENRNPNSAKAAPLKPCPPPKKVVRDGGSSEPTIQLMPGTAAEQASRQRSTEELKAAIDENLKKIAGRELNPSQREMVNQIKQFMEESKTAVASGDPERGHNLAMKARLLSDELVKP